MCQRICSKKLEEYDWPGNVRELEHVIVYGMSMVDETSALLQYKDIKGKLLLEKQADRKKTPESLEEVPKLCSSLREAVAAYEEKTDLAGVGGGARKYI